MMKNKIPGIFLPRKNIWWLYDRLIFSFILIISSFVTPLIYAKDQNQITNISTIDRGNQTELKFQLNLLPKYQVFTIPNPERLVIDFDQTVLSANITDFSHINEGWFGW